MEDRDLQFLNNVLNKGIQEVIRIGKHYTELNDDEIANNYEEAIKISTIHSILKLKDFLDDFQETAQIAHAGILESIVVEQYNDQAQKRINIHTKLVDMNNNVMTSREAQAARNELFSLLVQRAGMSTKRFIETAKNDFVADNLDLLTPSEKEKYQAMGFVL